ncbi:Octaprenyl diphosphate synthase [Enhygromyxa salina]|uniref:Octaprenyl diphosphate synthase n=1 Tax=Enhygromyxa salina TaxID=215803 RepID=A0A0C2DBK4_9BACT|nr:polyprenyl synthetase family protein [Enhygromyxa salina]KIG17147.1 Octaprenyl diphosphate synthase [Enhygromyxa salina]
MTDANFDLDAYFADHQTAVNDALAAALPEPTPGQDPSRLREAMRYAVLLGGKRMRPLLTIAACEAVGGQREDALPAGCALEMIHAYSLVHDDLPAMDNDVERRGQPTVHVAFGEGNAILVGDALLTEAFRVLVTGSRGIPRPLIAHAVDMLARHAGIDGMVGGQGLDLQVGQDVPALDLLERVHAQKTGGLFASAGGLGALSGGADLDVVAKLERYGLAFGVAFQHADDILDNDQPALRDAAAVRIRELTDECREIAVAFGPAGRPLAAIADWIDQRAARARAGEDLA